MIDPVTGFSYPEEWLKACKDDVMLELVEQGLAVLTSSGRVLRRGFTTGTTAAAACGAAVLSLSRPVYHVEMSLPCGLDVVLPVRAREGHAVCIKDSGDYSGDVTAGLEFHARAKRTDEGTELIAGEGIGRFTRDTPRYRNGEPAISSTAMESIMYHINRSMEEIEVGGVRVRLDVPEGVETAKQTLNSRIGVLGGISVLGSTGLVEPWDDHLTESAMDRIAAADRVVMTTGRIGLRYSRMLFPDHEAVLVGAKIREGIGAAKGDAVLCGLPALILRFINPGILQGTGCGTVEELSSEPEWDGIVKTHMVMFRKRYPDIRVVLVDRKGHIIGDTG